MARDPLETMLRLRERAVDEARVALARAVAAEAIAEDAARAAEQSIAHEAEQAADPAGGDDLVEAFAAWLPGARVRVAACRAEQERTGVDLNCRRAALAISRSGLEVIETLLRQKREAASERESRAMQQAIDEAAGRDHGWHG